ncbi:hypothetical protein PSTT_16046 [Puccinia striiformis]|uniref:Uncharacterized protein n=1 Tax=Puccinia striiformis TaxID=27350 RepID=A0A2S4UEZ0_9BASI|nr:hypothetical protein PSTT_16046 [Puccinia striiformis]
MTATIHVENINIASLASGLQKKSGKIRLFAGYPRGQGAGWSAVNAIGFQATVIAGTPASWRISAYGSFPVGSACAAVEPAGATLAAGVETIATMDLARSFLGEHIPSYMICIILFGTNTYKNAPNIWSSRRTAYIESATTITPAFCRIVDHTQNKDKIKISRPPVSPKQSNRNEIRMAPLVPCLVKLRIPHGESVPSSFSFPVDSETTTVADLKRSVIVEVESQNATLLGMYSGDTQIDTTENEDGDLLRDVLKLNTEREMICQVEFRVVDGNSNDLLAAGGALVGAAAGPVLVQASVAAVGFGGGGIVAGTPAAAFMASYGGSVAAGSMCAVLQSVGAVGLALGGTVVAAGVGGIVLYGVTRSLMNGRQSN